MDLMLKHHIESTEKKFDSISEDIKELSLKVDDLREFKTKLIISSRFFAFVVSAICGLVTLIASTVVTYYVNLKLNRG